MRTTDNYVFFYTGEDIYSNFYPATMRDGGNWFFCMEQYLMHEKALYFNDLYRASQIKNVASNIRGAPGICKAHGRKVQGFVLSEWQAIRSVILLKGLILKFQQNPELKKALLATDDRVLVEASGSDLIYGVGLKENDDRILQPENWRGLNLLGEALMECRSLIK